MGALDPALFESMTIVPGTLKDSIEGEEGKANDLYTIHSQGQFFIKNSLETAPGKIGRSLVVDAKRWRSGVMTR